MAEHGLRSCRHIDATVQGAAAQPRALMPQRGAAQRAPHEGSSSAPQLLSFRAEAINDLALDSRLERSRHVGRKYSGARRAEIITKPQPAVVESLQVDRAALTPTIESLRDVRE
jgi:hypothetical protein